MPGPPPVVLDQRLLCEADAILLLLSVGGGGGGYQLPGLVFLVMWTMVLLVGPGRRVAIARAFLTVFFHGLGEDGTLGVENR